MFDAEAECCHETQLARLAVADTRRPRMWRSFPAADQSPPADSVLPAAAAKTRQLIDSFTNLNSGKPNEISDSRHRHLCKRLLFEIPTYSLHGRLVTFRAAGADSSRPDTLSKSLRPKQHLFHPTLKLPLRTSDPSPPPTKPTASPTKASRLSFHTVVLCAILVQDLQRDFQREQRNSPPKRKRTDNDMADVEMTDAPKTKSSKAGPSGGDAGDNKPRFEVKKVTSKVSFQATV